MRSPLALTRPGWCVCCTRVCLHGGVHSHAPVSPTRCQDPENILPTLAAPISPANERAAMSFVIAATKLQREGIAGTAAGDSREFVALGERWAEAQARLAACGAAGSGGDSGGPRQLGDDSVGGDDGGSAADSEGAGAGQGGGDVPVVAGVVQAGGRVDTAGGVASGGGTVTGEPATATGSVGTVAPPACLADAQGSVVHLTRMRNALFVRDGERRVLTGLIKRITKQRSIASRASHAGAGASGAK